MSMPAQKPGRSFQAYQTPEEFLAAVRLRFGPIHLDAAASAHNAVAERFHDEAANGLVQSWGPGLTFVNPPYGNIRPWVQKAWAEAALGINTLMLVPLGCPNWWVEHVHGKAAVWMLQGRMSFDGKAPFPRDLALLHYGPAVMPGYGVWAWMS